MAQSYCQSVANLATDNVHRQYHDTAYGFPVGNDNTLLGRLILEINQAGLSWTTILNKAENFQRAYAQFDIAKIARFGDREKKQLLADAGIIRNQLKINAAIHNAQQVLVLQNDYGSFKAWLDSQCPLPLVEWVKLFKKTFKFTGGEITNEFLMSAGYLPGAHEPNCPIYKKVLIRKPAWASYQSFYR